MSVFVHRDYIYVCSALFIVTLSH